MNHHILNYFILVHLHIHLASAYAYLKNEYCYIRNPLYNLKDCYEEKLFDMKLKVPQSDPLPPLLFIISK